MAESVAQVCYAPSEPDLDNPSEGKRCIHAALYSPLLSLETIRKELLDLLARFPHLASRVPSGSCARPVTDDG